MNLRIMLLVIFLGVITPCASALTVEARANSEVESQRPKNIVLLIGDGMGATHMQAYRYFLAQLNDTELKPTIFDKYLLGSVSTSPHYQSGIITDSAAAATALSCGIQTYNGAIGVNIDRKPVPTLLAKAKSIGKVTGIIATSELVHATPAAFATHTNSRKYTDEIAKQFLFHHLTEKPIVDVLLGGGLQFFEQYISGFKELDYQVLLNRQDLQSTRSKKLLGLFANRDLPYSLEEQGNSPTLSEMTRVALRTLSQNKKGFVLVIESSKIDWAAHDNDLHSVLWEMHEFANTFSEVLAFAERDTNTLVLLTADHETGGLALGNKKPVTRRYFWSAAPYVNLKTNIRDFRDQLLALDSGIRVEHFIKSTGIALSSKQVKKLKKISSKKQLLRFIKETFDEEAGTGWSTTGHTAADVYLYGRGPASERFKKHQANWQIGVALGSILENRDEK